MHRRFSRKASEHSIRIREGYRYGSPSLRFSGCIVEYVSRESHFNKAVPPLREAYLLTLPRGEDEDGVGGADRGSLAHVVPQGAI